MVITGSHLQRTLRLAAALWLAAGCPALSAQPAVLNGRIMDADTGKPLPGASVFLNQTMIGDVTDEQGAFEIRHVAPGSYELIASMLGYVTGSEHLEIVPEQHAYELDVQLSQAVLALGEVQVVAKRPRRWKKDLKRFEKLFIGSRPNAGRTKILNPYVLDFETNADAFLARASAPLDIENRALGYRITFVLTAFRLDKHTNCHGSTPGRTGSGGHTSDFHQNRRGRYDEPIHRNQAGAA